MSKKKLVLHIGPHKTGSSYLQRTFYESSAAFREKGIYYPVEWVTSQYGHHKVSALLSRGKIEELVEFLADPLACEETLVISSENFDRLNNEEVALLRELFKDFEVTVVYFKRSAPGLVVSAWQERVKHGGTMSFFEFAFSHVVHPLNSRLLNHCLVLDNYVKYFGIEAIRILDYDSAALNRSLFDKFCEAADLVVLKGAGEHRLVNKSFDLWEIEIVRGLNLLARLENKLNGLNVRSAYLAKKEAEEVRKLTTRLKGIIDRWFVEFDLETSELITLLEDNFHQRYRLFEEVPPTTEVAKKLVPEDGWMGNPRVWNLVKKLYAHLEL